MESASTASYKTSIIVPQPSQNVLLSLLTPETAARIYPHLQLVPLELGHVLLPLTGEFLNAQGVRLFICAFRRGRDNIDSGNGRCARGTR